MHAQLGWGVAILVRLANLLQMGLRTNLLLSERNALTLLQGTWRYSDCPSAKNESSKISVYTVSRHENNLWQYVSWATSPYGYEWPAGQRLSGEWCSINLARRMCNLNNAHALTCMLPVWLLLLRRSWQHVIESSLNLQSYAVFKSIPTSIKKIVNGEGIVRINKYTNNSRNYSLVVSTIGTCTYKL